MFVKICGITNPEDALAAAEMGAQALGFIQYPKSPRYVAPAALQEWIGLIPAHVWKVGVFVDEAPLEIEGICQSLGFAIAQLHGEETPEDHPRGLQVWKAFRVTPQHNLDADYPADAILLDGPGGGRTFDWSVTSRITRPCIVAGGLDEHNVRQAIEASNPWGVDISSGIELSPGRKDHARMKRFIEVALNQ